MTHPAPQSEAIQTALERLLAWPEMARSPQLGRFLDYIVQRTLEGNEQSIKAYSIAVDVFGRPAEFDPQTDPIVRVQARRLRALLDEYYQGPGLAEVMQIRLPVGRYVPEFAAVPDPGTPTPPPARPVSLSPPTRWTFGASWFTLAVIALGLAMSAYAVNRWQSAPAPAAGAIQRPTITVVEFQNLANAGSAAPQVAGLAIELVTDLEQFGTVVARYGGGGAANVPVSNLPTSDFVLTGIVRPDGDVIQYSAILTDSRTGSVVSNQTVAVPAATAVGPEVLDMVSRTLSLVLGSPRGPLHASARQYIATNSIEGGENPYLCRMLFDLYRETGGTREAERAGACYAALPEADRNSAMALAASAILLFEHGGQVQGDGSPAERLGQAEDRLVQAVGLDPLNSFVWEQQGRLHEATGEQAQARADYSSSVQLNPASVDALAAYARLLALGGSLTEAEAMALDAERSPDPPPWYRGVPALLALRDGDFAGAIAEAEVYAQADHELGPILAIIAAQQSGDNAVVNRFLPQVLDVPSFRARGVLVRLRERVADNELLGTIRDSLVLAGVPSMALTRPF